jgi:hypothetical protein
MFRVPILLLCWRRPAAIRQVIDAIRALEPVTIFVACDGPSLDRFGEAQKVDQTRLVIDQHIDWPCNIRRLYSEHNQGCYLGVSRAITWFFSHVEEGIILEDDCVPHPDFFPYCSTLLERYRDDTRVWCISASNFQDKQWRGDGSYYFSRYNHCWGWASWRRCWQQFDSDLSQWPNLRDSGLMNSVFEDPIERAYWSKIWQCLFDTGKPDSWAFRWFFTCLSNGGLTALPNRNLVNNVGFGEDATHTKSNQVDTAISEGLIVQRHPSFVLRDLFADRYTFDHFFGGKWQRLPYSLCFSLKAMVRKALRASVYHC